MARLPNPADTDDMTPELAAFVDELEEHTVGDVDVRVTDNYVHVGGNSATNPELASVENLAEEHDGDIEIDFAARTFGWTIMFYPLECLEIRDDENDEAWISAEDPIDLDSYA